MCVCGVTSKRVAPKDGKTTHNEPTAILILEQAANVGGTLAWGIRPLQCSETALPLEPRKSAMVGSLGKRSARTNLKRQRLEQATGTRLHRITADGGLRE